MFYTEIGVKIAGALNTLTIFVLRIIYQLTNDFNWIKKRC